MIRFLSSILALFSVTTIYAQQNAIPKLVVGITIDQLRGDYLEHFKKNFGEKGFKRLLNEGVVYNQMVYNFPSPDKASATTTIYTGTVPFYHGIVSDKKISSEDFSEVSSFLDSKFMGNFTSEKLSPLPLKVSTITDELKVASNGKSDVFAFSSDASGALASGGHLASGAFWIEDFTGHWATTTFYTTYHRFIDEYNRSDQSLNTRISSLVWKPKSAIETYNAFPYTQNIKSFQHNLATNKNNNFRLLKQTPYINEEIRKMGVSAIKNAELGKKEVPDFLALNFYAGNFDQALDKNYSIEIQDTYQRLDQDIAQIIDAVDEAVGLENAFIFVVSTGYFDEQEVYPKEARFSGGDFKPDRCEALLNMYLMAIYGRENWIKKYHNEQIYFDRKLIEEKKVDYRELQERAADFLIQFSGVQDVITSYQMLHGAYNEAIQVYKNGFHRDITGDLFIELQPGWRIVTNKNPTNHKRVRSNAMATPAIFFGNNLRPQKVNRVIDATEIAPSVTHRLRIRAPNASNNMILQELF
ncbi:MAG: alkaline phosphatase family protein [Dysgonamonadaceae bacterium]|nr:alkaline phosphatase family protein [Dysgonamonadaceae bacterium]MDD4729494.1 alkaline phosphatase family protein [Dysgonamonadaceae bacterium]